MPAWLRVGLISLGASTVVAFGQQERRDIYVQPPTPPGLAPAPRVGVEIRTETAPPARRREEIRERERHDRDAVWVPGYWAWEGRRYVWVQGRWERPPEGRRVWVEPRWERRHEGGYSFHEGYWR